MIKLYGSPVSNCYNTVLAALHYKGLAVKEQHGSASAGQAFLQHSPMGKIPYVVHGEYSISETSAIVEYVDEVFAGPALFPGDALQRARQRQLMKFVELYVEAPARRLFPGVFWCQSNPQLHIDEVRPVMERGLTAIGLLLQGSAFLRQTPACAAGFYSYFSLNLAALVTRQQYNWELIASSPGIHDYLEGLDGLAFMKTIIAQRDDAMAAYLAKKAAEAQGG
ncbi:glutathione S-transferase family protein [Haliea sp.]|uniref:glutathione S-transferase family protein n=1 Tax=Haliea sp. TaxID=1932666 RepID=UPI00257A073C|nr:glutathione S-transferase family protein [Haliea sp.]